MIYAVSEELKLIVGAADKLAEFQDFYRNILKLENVNFTCSQPDFMEMLIEFKGFREPPYVFEFETKQDQDAFIADHEIHLSPRFFVVDKQAEMLKHTIKDDYFADKRTLGEIYGLNEYDPWDTRTDEEKEKDKDHKKLAEEAKKKGNLTGDSFSMPSEPKLQVTDVRAHRDKDNEIVIEDILAVKGLYSDTVEKVVQDKKFRLELSTQYGESGSTSPAPSQQTNRLQFRFDQDEVLAHRFAIFHLWQYEGEGVRLFEEIDGVENEIHADFEIAQKVHKGKDKIYYKLVVNEPFGMLNIPPIARTKIIDQATVGEYTWLIFNQKATAALVEASLAGKIVEVFPVDVNGGRLVPEGINLYEEKPFIEPPRPWNEKADELLSMTPEQLKKNHESLSGKEFLFSGRYLNAQSGCVMYVTPRSYFDRTGETWGGELNIRELLPLDIKEVSPGVYQTRSREWMSLYHDMQKRGFVESMAFQLYINLML